MLIQSAGGDVSPRADGGPALQRIERFGKLLAPQVLAIADGETAPDAQPAITNASQRILLDRERLGYTGDEYPYPWGAVQCNAEPRPRSACPLPRPAPPIRPTTGMPRRTLSCRSTPD
jgi:hypothetical protein